MEHHEQGDRVIPVLPRDMDDRRLQAAVKGALEPHHFRSVPFTRHLPTGGGRQAGHQGRDHD